MIKKRYQIFFLITILLFIYSPSWSETFFIANQSGNIYKDKKEASEIIGKFKNGDIFILEDQRYQERKSGVRIEKENGIIILTNETIEGETDDFDNFSWCPLYNLKSEFIGYAKCGKGEIYNEPTVRDTINKYKKYEEYIKQREKEIAEEEEEKSRRRNLGLRIGMKIEEAIYLWGNPQSINESVGPWGKDEEWVYEKYGLYLYFRNGILTSYQKSR